MKLPSAIRFADEKIKEAFYKLEQGDDQEKDFHEDLTALRQEVKELKDCFHEDFLPLTAETITAVQEARKRMKKKFVSHEEMCREFGG